MTGANGLLMGHQVGFTSERSERKTKREIMEAATPFRKVPQKQQQRSTKQPTYKHCPHASNAFCYGKY
jgi:hypothetical protein